MSRRLARLSADLDSRRAAEEPLTTESPEVPVPGRHASRRGGRALVVLVPETLRGRASLGPPQLTVVAVIVALGLAVTCWWVIRSDSSVVPAPTLASSPPLASGVNPSTATEPSASPGRVTVDVAGRVRDPGIAVLDAGSRVIDAVEAAGGARRGVDLSVLNLARVLVDGEQILVGIPGPTGLAASELPGAVPSSGPLVNLNTASQTELESLPQIGPVTAQAILAWRTEHGGFAAVDELLEVDGIGEATLAQVAPYVTV